MMDPGMNDRMAQPFSKQSGGQQRKTIGKFVEAFDAAGQDLGGLLASFLSDSPLGKSKSNDIKSHVRESLKEWTSDTDHVLDTLVTQIREIHASKSTNDRERLRIMSLVAPLFTRAELLRRGFKVSNDAFANARRHAASHGSGAPVPSGGRPKIYGDDLARLVDEFCSSPENSYPNPAYNTNHIPQHHHHHLQIDQNSMQLMELNPNAPSPSLHHLDEIPDAEEEEYTDEAHSMQMEHSSNLSNAQAQQQAQQQLLTNENGQPIPLRILKYPISALHTKFGIEHPLIKITYQAMRALIPPHIGKKPRDSDMNDNVVESQQQQGIHHNVMHHIHSSSLSTSIRNSPTSINNNLMNNNSAQNIPSLSNPLQNASSSSSSMSPSPVNKKKRGRPSKQDTANSASTNIVVSMHSDPSVHHTSMILQHNDVHHHIDHHHHHHHHHHGQQHDHDPSQIDSYPSASDVDVVVVNTSDDQTNQIEDDELVPEPPRKRIAKKSL